jgi:hypothetical protein
MWVKLDPTSKATVLFALYKMPSAVFIANSAGCKLVVVGAVPVASERLTLIIDDINVPHTYKLSLPKEATWCYAYVPPSMIASICPRLPELVELAAVYVIVVPGSVAMLLTTTNTLALASLKMPE